MGADRTNCYILLTLLIIVMAGISTAQEISMNVSTLGGFLYNPSDLVTQLHELPRPDYTAFTTDAFTKKVVKFTVADNDFEPDNDDYRTAVAISSLYLAGPAALLILLYYVGLCTRGCCKGCCTQCDKNQSCGNACLIFYYIIALAVICLCYFPRQKFQDAIHDEAVVLEGLIQKWDGINTSMTSITKASTDMTASFNSAGCESGTVASLSPGLDQFRTISAEHETFTSDLLVDVKSLKADYLDDASLTVDIYLGCLVGMVVLLVVFVTLAIANKSQTVLDISVVLGNITFIIFFVAAIVQFLFSLTASDYCSSPDKGTFYMIENYMEATSFKYASYFVICAADPTYQANPLVTDLTASKTFLTSLEASKNAVTFNSCTNQQAVNTFFGHVAAADKDVTGLSPQVICKEIAVDYISATKSMCGDMVDGLTWLWGVMIVCTVMLYIALWHSACVRANFIGTEDESTAEEKQPLTAVEEKV